MIKICLHCSKDITINKYGNNKKYCSVKCRHDASYESRRRSWVKFNYKLSIIKGMPATDKIECLICHLFYYKPMSHAWQKHGISAREYKNSFELEQKGLIPENAKKHLRVLAYKHREIVIDKNLTKKGVNTRFTVGHTRTYIRKAITIEKLKERFKAIKNKNK